MAAYESEVLEGLEPSLLMPAVGILNGEWRIVLHPSCFGDVRPSRRRADIMVVITDIEYVAHEAAALFRYNLS